MRLVIREYLSMLKESGELDALLPDLLLSMDIVPTSKAQVGVRQFGVDVAGIGADPDRKDRRRTLFLFTVKRGDFDRASWDAGGDVQAVRPSLNEIQDVYLQQQVSEAHRNLPKKVVLCCGGSMKQNVKPNWEGYVEEHAETGALEFAFWGGDKLALLIEQHMLDEHLFPESARKQMRKTISLVDENERPPQHFYDLARETLFERDLPTGGSKRDIRKRQRALRLLHLSLNIVFHWAREAENLRPALLCAERALLTTWDWMREEGLFDCTATHNEFALFFRTYLSVASIFSHRLMRHCFTEDGLFNQGFDETEYPLRTFEAISVLALTSLTYGVFAELAAAARSTGSPGENGENHQRAEQTEEADVPGGEELPPEVHLKREGQAISNALAHLIHNNASALTPCYDEHAIDISIGLLALVNGGFDDEARSWVEQLGRRIVFAFDSLGRRFPIATDSYEHLVAMQVGKAPPKEKLMEMSTLLPILAHWHVLLDQDKEYRRFSEEVSEVFSETHMQMWYPGEATDEHLYKENAGWKSGITLSPIELPDDLEKLKEQIERLSEERQEHRQLSCFEHGWPLLGLIASRHFRTPVAPVFWQAHITAGDE